MTADETWSYTDVTLACGHVRSVDVGLARRVARGGVAELWCNRCGCVRAVKP